MNAHDALEILQRELQCVIWFEFHFRFSPVSLDVYDDPHSLVCLHNFCGYPLHREQLQLGLACDRP